MLTKPINPWWTVLAGFMGCALAGGIIMIYVFSFFTNTISEDNQFDREVLAFCFTFFLIRFDFSGTYTTWCYK